MDILVCTNISTSNSFFFKFLIALGSAITCVSLFTSSLQSHFAYEYWSICRSTCRNIGMGVQLHMTNIYYHWVQNRGILAKKSPFSGKMF